MSPKRRYLEILYVRWIDPEVLAGWTAADDISQDFIPIHTVGYVVRSDIEQYVLALAYDPECDSFNGIIRIPKTAVQKVRSVTIQPLKV